ncbi:MAG: hypothetical protein AB7O24_04375 [Kofleriaceae bacterium]
MDDETKAAWLQLGEQLFAECPEKYQEVVSGLGDVIEAQRIIARFDWQLLHRGRPRKVYRA